MSLEALDRFVNVQFANVDTLIRGTTGERRIRLPVDVQRWGAVKAELLSALTARRIPNNRCLVDTGAENVVAALIPLQCEYRTLVLTEGGSQSAIGRPDSCVTVVTAGRQESSVALFAGEKC